MVELFVWVEPFVWYLRLYTDLELFVWHSAAVRDRAGPPILEVNWNYGNLIPKGYAGPRIPQFLLAGPRGSNYLSIRTICMLYICLELFVCFLCISNYLYVFALELFVPHPSKCGM